MQKETTEIRKLSPEIDKKFSLIKIQAGEVLLPKFGKVDFRTMSLKQAEKLYDAGCPYLELKSTPKKNN
jgi:hypothetical protein